MAAAALVICYSGFTMLRKAMKAPKDTASAKGDATTAPPAAETPFELTGRHIAYGVAIGLFAGLISGYVGVGGGFIMVPLMMSVIGLPMKKASGTSLIAVLILAIPGAISQGLLGNIDYLTGIATACGTIPGAYLGGQLAGRVPERTLRFAFAGFLAIAAVLTAVKEFSLL